MTLEPFAVLLLGAMAASFLIVLTLLAAAFGSGVWFWKILGRFAEIRLTRAGSVVKVESTIGTVREVRPRTLQLGKGPPS